MSAKVLIAAITIAASACTAVVSGGSPIDGTWTVALRIHIAGASPQDEPTFRTFTFASDCSARDCQTTGMIENADGLQQVDVDFDGTDYTFEFNRTATWAPDGTTLCEWTSTMQYRIHPSDFDADGHATSIEGELVETPQVTTQAEGIDCLAPPFVSTLTATLQG